jgi:hypothetical protein
MNPYGRRRYGGRGGHGYRGGYGGSGSYGGYGSSEGYGGRGGYSGRADSDPYAHLSDEQKEAIARQMLGQIESNIRWLQSNINNTRGGGGGRYGRRGYGRGG